jgi:hypothetical protein
MILRKKSSKKEIGTEGFMYKFPTQASNLMP